MDEPIERIDKILIVAAITIVVGALVIAFLITAQIH
jgi:hypothetical protein